MTNQQHTALIDAAVEARQRAYAPYSNYHVGAAVLSTKGEIFAGANVENASYGLTICAERVAAATAVAAGHDQLVAAAVATPGGASPCGACRQFLSEFGSSMEIWLVDTDDQAKANKTDLATLLPRQFRLDS